MSPEVEFIILAVLSIALLVPVPMSLWVIVKNFFDSKSYLESLDISLIKAALIGISVPIALIASVLILKAIMPVIEIANIKTSPLALVMHFYCWVVFPLELFLGRKEKFQRKFRIVRAFFLIPACYVIFAAIFGSAVLQRV